MSRYFGHFRQFLKTTQGKMTKNNIFNEKRVIFNFLSNKKHIFAIVLLRAIDWYPYNTI